MFRRDALKVTREISNDTLIIRKYSLPWGEKFSLEEVDSKWEASDLGKEVYTLNADGTRPLTRYNYIEYAPGISTRSYEYESEVTGRLEEMTAAVTLRVKDIDNEEIDVKVGDEDWLLGVYGGRTSEEAYIANQN